MISNSRRRNAIAGFTLIELLVVIAYHCRSDRALLAGRAGGARGGSADAMLNNLKQIALATHSYVDAAGTLPIGTPMQRIAAGGPVQFPYISGGVFLALRRITIRRPSTMR